MPTGAESNVVCHNRIRGRTRPDSDGANVWATSANHDTALAGLAKAPWPSLFRFASRYHQDL